MVANITNNNKKNYLEMPYHQEADAIASRKNLVMCSCSDL